MTIFKIVLAAFLAGSLNGVTGSFGSILILVSLVSILGIYDAILIAPVIYLGIGWQYISNSINYINDKKFLLIISVSSLLGGVLGFFILTTISENTYFLKIILAITFILFGSHYIFYSYSEPKPKFKGNVFIYSIVSFVSSVVSSITGSFDQPILELVYDRTKEEQLLIRYIIIFSCYLTAIFKSCIYLSGNLIYSALVPFSVIGICAGILGSILGKRYERNIYSNQNMKLILSVIVIIAGLKLLLF